MGHPPAGVEQPGSAQKRVEVELRMRIRQQEIVAELGLHALAPTDLDDLLAGAVAGLAEGVGAECCGVLELLPGGDELRLRAGIGWRYAGEVRVPVGAKSHGGYALLSSEPVVVDDLRSETRFRVPPGLIEEAVVSGANVVIGGGQRPFGTVGVYTRAPRKFTTDDVNFLQSVANVLAAAIERRSIDQRLRIADRMASVGLLAAGIAHEINNPLAYVIANLGYLGEALNRVSPAIAEDNAEVRDVLKEAHEGCERIKQIVRDLKTFSREDETPAKPVKMRGVIESAINMAWNEIRHRARLVKDFAEVPLVLAKECRLGQVFLNLLVNAAQAIPEGRVEDNEIRVTVRADAGRVRVQVRDTGCGIAPETLPRIFDPLFTTKPVGIGTGLGLSISHSIVTGMGGEITVQSEVGKGTTFTVSLPACG